MLTKTRSDFWKCACWIGAIMEACGAINAGSDAQCQECGYDWSAAGTEYTPATNVEVLIAWLSADEERRREIEIASRPTKAGEYKNYKWEGGTLQMTGWHFGEAWFDSGHTISGLWEPIE